MVRFSRQDVGAPRGLKKAIGALSRCYLLFGHKLVFSEWKFIRPAEEHAADCATCDSGVTNSATSPLHTALHHTHVDVSCHSHTPCTRAASARRRALLNTAQRHRHNSLPRSGLILFPFLSGHSLIRLCSAARSRSRAQCRRLTTHLPSYLMFASMPSSLPAPLSAFTHAPAAAACTTSVCARHRCRVAVHSTNSLSTRAYRKDRAKFFPPPFQ